MRADLLRFIGGPLSPSWWWLALAALIVLLLAAWIAGVVIWTMPPHRLRTIPVVRGLHATLTRKRFTRAIGNTTELYGKQELSREEAATAYNKTLRSFLAVRTGMPVQYTLAADLAEGDLADAVPLLTDLHDAQFNPESHADVPALGRSAEELIHAWT